MLRPYVIVAPGYTEKSWGVRTLHQLCHMLNVLNVPAYMLLTGGTATRPDWRTPAARVRHLRDGIVIYPEVITDNFLGAKRVVRWLLNRPGYITGKSIQYGPDDFVVATGESHSVSEFLDETFGYVDLDWREYVKIDPRYFRPSEVDALEGDSSKARKALGWELQVSFKALARMMVEADLELARREVAARA